MGSKNKAVFLLFFAVKKGKVLFEFQIHKATVTRNDVKIFFLKNVYFAALNPGTVPKVDFGGLGSKGDQDRLNLSLQLKKRFNLNFL